MKFDDLLDRKGTFSVTRRLIEENPNVVMRMMGNVLIVKAEAQYMNDTIEYHAYSPWFDKCHPAVCAPEYTVESNGVDFMFLQK